MNKTLVVLQLIDSLSVGGAERMSVNIANALAKETRIKSLLVATRTGGELEEFISTDVTFLCLKKKGRIDLSGLKKLWNFINEYKVTVIHAHSSSIFWAFLMKLRKPKLKIVLHDHYGMIEHSDERPKAYNLLKLIKSKLHHYIVVNEMIKKWGIENLGMDTKDISYLKNFAAIVHIDPKIKKQIPGSSGKRIVCLANIRQQKDHLFLINVAKVVCNRFPDWSFLCVGSDNNDAYSDSIKASIQRNELSNNVFLLGSRTDVFPILKACQIGILTSRSEGLPVSLLEYGIAKLPVVCTDVGQCSEVINQPEYVIQHGNIEMFANAVIGLINDESLRKKQAAKFNQRVCLEYTEESAVKRLLSIYE